MSKPSTPKRSIVREEKKRITKPKKPPTPYNAETVEHMFDDLFPRSVANRVASDMALFALECYTVLGQQYPEHSRFTAENHFSYEEKLEKLEEAKRPKAERSEEKKERSKKTVHFSMNDFAKNCLQYILSRVNYELLANVERLPGSADVEQGFNTFVASTLVPQLEHSILDLILRACVEPVEYITAKHRLNIILQDKYREFSKDIPHHIAEYIGNLLTSFFQKMAFILSNIIFLGKTHTVNENMFVMAFNTATGVPGAISNDLLTFGKMKQEKPKKTAREQPTSPRKKNVKMTQAEVSRQERKVSSKRILAETYDETSDENEEEPVEMKTFAKYKKVSPTPKKEISARARKLIAHDEVSDNDFPSSDDEE